MYPVDEHTSLTFEQAERYDTPHYRQAVEAELAARPVLADRTEQLPLL